MIRKSPLAPLYERGEGKFPPLEKGDLGGFANRRIES